MSPNPHPTAVADETSQPDNRLTPEQARSLNLRISDYQPDPPDPDPDALPAEPDERGRFERLTDWLVGAVEWLIWCLVLGWLRD